jgi:hypothetical protein
MKNKMHNAEHVEQTSLFEWAELNKHVIPELEWLHAIPNGGVRPATVRLVNGEWRRFSFEGAKLKKEGVKPGVPDVMLPVAKRSFYGLYIEMKVGKNEATDEQIKWHEGLRSNGYYVQICRDWISAKDLIYWYLGAVLFI